MIAIAKPYRRILATAALCLSPVAQAEQNAASLVQGLFSKTKTAVTGEASSQSAGSTPSNGDRSLRSEPDVARTSGFSDFLSRNEKFTESGFFPTMKPRVDRYYLFNSFPMLEFSSINGLEGFKFDGFLKYGYGYRNSEQMFCDTMRHTLIEEEGGRSPAGDKTNAEVISAILNDSGSASARGYDGTYATKKVKFIDEFGGDLAVQTKKSYLTTLLQNKPDELEAIRFLTKSEANAFTTACYAGVNGNQEVDPLEFAPPEEDYLLNKIPEVRDFLAKRRSEQDADRAREAARAARDRKIELERQAEAQEAALAQQKALELRRAKDAAESDRIQQSLTQKQQEQSALAQKQDSREKAAQDQGDAEARRKAALEALSR